MQLIEQSRKIKLTKDVSLDDIKAALIAHLEKGLTINESQHGESRIQISAYTSGPFKFIRQARLDLTISLEKNQEILRIVVSGRAHLAHTMAAFYALLLLVVLFIGLLPGSIETHGQNSGAGDALVFIIFGLFIFYDTHNKMTEPVHYIRSVLDTMDTQYG